MLNHKDLLEYIISTPALNPQKLLTSQMVNIAKIDKQDSTSDCKKKIKTRKKLMTCQV